MTECELCGNALSGGDSHVFYTTCHATCAAERLRRADDNICMRCGTAAAIGTYCADCDGSSPYIGYPPEAP